MKRRQFLKGALATGTTLSLTPRRAFSANDETRLGVIGIGSFVKIGGKGRGDIRDFRRIPGVRVVALCDCDTDHLNYEVNLFQRRNEPVKPYKDFRRLLDADYRSGNWQKNANQTMDRFRGVRTGTVVACEGGYLADGAAYDNEGTQIRKFTRSRVSTKQNFIDAVRSRDAGSLHADALEGHLSCGLVHMANISHRLGRETPNEEIRDAIGAEHELRESFGRLERHLTENRINLREEPLMLGPMLTMDPKKERFVGPFSGKANQLVSRQYREPFVVRDYAA